MDIIIEIVHAQVVIRLSSNNSTIRQPLLNIVLTTYNDRSDVVYTKSFPKTAGCIDLFTHPQSISYLL